MLLLTVNYCEILKSDIANGEGVRVTLFVAGCTHHCKGCFNPQTWDFNAGKPFTREEEDMILAELAHPWVAGLTLLGGEPMEPANQRALLPFLRRVKAETPDKTIWCYTGCVMEQDFPAEAPGAAYWRTEVTDELLGMFDVVVDGPFVESLKDITLRFRGSSNQRILHRLPNNAAGRTPAFIEASTPQVSASPRM